MNRVCVTGDSTGPLWVRITGTVVGALSFWIYNRSWESWWRFIYDVPASIAVFSFLAQVLAELVAGNTGKRWRIRFGLVVAMTVITNGREFLGWPMSGHVTDVTAVALLQTFDSRLPRWLRALYWIPLPILVTMRLTVNGAPGHAPLLGGLTTGLILGVIAVLLIGRRRHEYCS
jgi:hypothetical protein